MKIKYKSSLLRTGKLFVFLAGSLFVKGQSVEIGSAKDDALRTLQLQGKLDAKFSLMARPFYSDVTFTTDSIYNLVDTSSNLKLSRKRINDNSVFEVFPLTIGSQLNTHHPYGWNHAGFIQARGIQGLVSTGGYVAIGPLSIQLKPVLVYAANPDFEHTGTYGNFTKGTYTRVLPGQSAVRLNAGAVSLGLSSENLWWGPGINNSLLMSNNAPGFWHLSFNTRRPLKTAIGNFEWQLIMGRLVEDTMVLLENKNLTTGYYNPENYGGDGYSGSYDPAKKWRYLNGLTITYNPKWMPGFFIGLSRVAYTYNDNLNKGGFGFFHKYFPTIFGAFRQNYAYGNDTGSHPINYKQMASVHMRYLFQKTHAELYGEYGIGDNSYNTRDLFLDPQHSAAYIAGFRKLKPLANNQWLDINAEITHLAQSTDLIVRNSGNWYGYQGGYTNQSRILGAGFGMGSNMQTLRITHLKSWSKLGFLLQRIQHDPKGLTGGPNATMGMRNTQWNDLALGFNGQKMFKKWLLNGECQLVQSKNYAWQQDQNRFNLYAFLSLNYYW